MESIFQLQAGILSATFAMSRKPPEHLFANVAAARQHVEQLMERLIGLGQPALRTREWVLPQKDGAILEWIRKEKHNRHKPEEPEFQPNRLIRGDELQVMAALAAEQEADPTLRGKIGVICLDSHYRFDEMPDPRAPGFELPDDFLQHMAGITLRLMLAHRLLGEGGIFCMRLNRHLLLPAKALIDDIFGHRSLTCRTVRDGAPRPASAGAPAHDGESLILFCNRSASSAMWTYAFRQFDAQRLNSRTRQAAAKGVFPAAAQDAPPVGRATNQRTWRRLIERIIVGCTSADSMVLDLSRYASMTAVVAEGLQRHWVASAPDAAACRRIRKRLVRQNVKPFLFQLFKDEFRPDRRHSAPGGGPAHLALLLYGAAPLPAQDGQAYILGHMDEGGFRTLVLAEIPGRPTGQDRLADLAALRDAAPGEWDKAVLLGWDFEPSFAAGIADMADDRIDIVAISPDLLDMLDNNGSIGKLEGKPCFISLRTHAVIPPR